MHIILASKSPRRKELLSEITNDFDIVTRDVNEDLPTEVHPRDGVELLAVRKGAAVAEEYPEAMVISSDTLVEVDGCPLGKPADENEAFEMLRRLSGRAHNVHTGVAVHFCGKVFSGTDTTEVVFRQMSDAEIWDYISTGEPMDKAGAYGIQGLGGRFVSEYRGSFDTVVGLSVSLTRRLMEAANDQK